MAQDTSVPMSIVELEKVTNACSMERNFSLHKEIDELYKNIVLNLIADQSIADQMKALFELKIMNVNRCIKCNYMNCNKELGSSINLPILLTQPAITYSNLTKETLEQGVKYVQS